MTQVLVSTAYLPPISYFSIIAEHGRVTIENNENYIKQTYRNRCNILSSHGIQVLTVPVLRATLHKVRISEVRIDYSKRWQQVHLRAMIAAYKSSPYFDFYFDKIESIICENHEFLKDLNMSLLFAIVKMLRIEADIALTDKFIPPRGDSGDFRYSLVPGTPGIMSIDKYTQVFAGKGFFPDLSIVDLIFNTGPEAIKYIIGH
ncbi:MAG TPA: WbqC family protein [Bacteroidales bacterium]|nr:WbqC family protein [Bacteroidales bacterium]